MLRSNGAMLQQKMPKFMPSHKTKLVVLETFDELRREANYALSRATRKTIRGNICRSEYKWFHYGGRYI